MRSAVLAAIVALLLSGVTPVAAAPSVTSRATSCAGTGFFPTNGSSGYGTRRTARLIGGTGICALQLPDHVTIRSARFTVRDMTPGGVSCSLVRSNLSADTSLVMARVASNGQGAAMVLTDSSVSSATVDNAHYAYSFQCTLPSPNNGESGIIGAEVAY